MSNCCKNSESCDKQTMTLKISSKFRSRRRYPNPFDFQLHFREIEGDTNNEYISEGLPLYNFTGAPNTYFKHNAPHTSASSSHGMNAMLVNGPSLTPGSRPWHGMGQAVIRKTGVYVDNGGPYTVTTGAITVTTTGGQCENAFGPNADPVEIVVYNSLAGRLLYVGQAEVTGHNTLVFSSGIKVTLQEGDELYNYNGTGLWPVLGGGNVSAGSTSITTALAGAGGNDARHVFSENDNVYIYDGNQYVLVGQCTALPDAVTINIPTGTLCEILETQLLFTQADVDIFNNNNNNAVLKGSQMRNFAYKIDGGPVDVLQDGPTTDSSSGVSGYYTGNLFFSDSATGRETSLITGYNGGSKQCSLLDERNGPLDTQLANGIINPTILTVSQLDFENFGKKPSIVVNGGTDDKHYYDKMFIENMYLSVHYLQQNQRFLQISSYNSKTKRVGTKSIDNVEATYQNVSFADGPSKPAEQFSTDQCRIRRRLPIIQGFSNLDITTPSRKYSPPAPAPATAFDSGTYDHGSNGAIVELELVTKGDLSGFPGSPGTTTFTVGGHTKIQILNTSGDYHIKHPGSGHTVGQLLTTSYGTWEYRVKKIGQSVVIGNGSSNNTVPENISQVHNAYKDKLFFCPSKLIKENLVATGRFAGTYIEEDHTSAAIIDRGHAATTGGGSRWHDNYNPRFSLQSNNKYKYNTISNDSTGTAKILLSCYDNLEPDPILPVKTSNHFLVLENGFSEPVKGNSSGGYTATSDDVLAAMDSKSWEILHIDDHEDKTLRLNNSRLNTTNRRCEVCLGQLIVPNITYNNIGELPRLSSIFLELKMGTSSTSQIGITNIPHTFTFEIPISDKSRCVDADFLKFTSATKHIMNLNLYANIQMKITDIDGNVLIPNVADIIPPFCVDDKLQTSAYFTIKQL